MLKPILRDQTVSMVSLQDPAFDLEKSPEIEVDGDTVLEYAVERFRDPSSWRRLLKTHDGQQPTEFLLGIIPAAEHARIEDECARAHDRRWRELCWRSFCAALCDIKGGFDMAGVPRVKTDGVSYIDPAWIHRTFVGTLYEVAIELGAVAWQWNRMGGDDGKN